MDETRFLALVQARTARISVGASTARNQGSPGVVLAARSYLAKLDLGRFVVDDSKAFRRALDKGTGRLAESLPLRAQNWGIARKLLNIFLRECMYTTYLEEHFGLGRVEEYMEIPLDSITSKALRKAAGRGVLPGWPGIKRLDVAVSDKYQRFAAEVAAQHGIARIHLDTIWWGRAEELGVKDLTLAAASGV